jgi:TonB family protein
LNPRRGIAGILHPIFIGERAPKNTASIMKFLSRAISLFLALASLSLVATAATPDVKPAKPSEKVDILPKVVKGFHPVYPVNLKDSGLSGDVVVEFDVDEFGRVKNAKAIKSPHPEMSKAAVEAINQSVYRPARKDGKSVPMTLRATMTFTSKKKK